MRLSGAAPLAALLAVLPATGPAGGATRGFSLTDFDRIRLSGPYEVSVRVGPAVSARAEGDAAALDHALLGVEGGTLSIRYDRTQSGADRPARLRIVITVPRLRGATVSGSGSLAIDRVRAESVALAVAGSGALQVDEVGTDSLTVTLVGSGRAIVGGKAANARITVQGDGRADAAKLVATDAIVSLSGAGTIAVGAGRTAKVNATGAGDVTVTGTPTCTVRNEGSGTVLCGG